MKQAWIENNKIRDICQGNPNELYHPDIAKLYTVDVPDNAENGDCWVNDQLIKPVFVLPVIVPIIVIPPKVSVIKFLMLFTSTERIATRSSVDPIVMDWWALVNDPRTQEVDLNLSSVQSALDYLHSTGLLAIGRKEQILIAELI